MKAELLQLDNGIMVLGAALGELAQRDDVAEMSYDEP